MFWLESVKLGTFFRGIFDLRFVKRIADGVFTPFAKNFGDLEDGASLLQIQTLDLFDLGTCESRLLAHLLPHIALSLSGHGPG